MSYTIEYDRKIFKMPEGTLIPEGFGKMEHTLIQDNFFIFTKSGCNNIDPRPKRWHLTAFGWNYEVISSICERAGWTESGTLQLPSGKITPEAYLKIYRKELKTASLFSLKSLQQATGIYGGYYYLNDKHNCSPEWVNKSIDKIKDWFEYYGEYNGYYRYDIRFYTLNHFRAFLHFQHIVNKMGGYIDVQSYMNK